MTSPAAFESFRADFAAVREGIYLNAAARSILSDTVMAAVRDLLEQHQSGRTHKEAWDGVLQSCKQRFAELVGAHPDQVAYTRNVSDGINTVANALPWKSGDNVVLCPDVEHPNNIYPWLNLRARGVEVRAVGSRADAIDTQAMLDAIDARTRVVTVATVSFTPGFRADVAALGRACRERGVFLMVDAVQSAGVLALDVEAANIDGLATASAKGLLGLYGLGFLYVRQSWIERMHPAYLARFSVDQGAAHESEMGNMDFTLQPDARRFEVGHHPFLGVAAADASLAQLLALGPDRIEAHVTALAVRLADGLAALGLPVCRPPEAVTPTHIVTVGRLGEGGAYSTGDVRLNAVAERLQAANVRFSVRRGLLRFAAHAYNDASDIEAVLNLAGETPVVRRAG